MRDESDSPAPPTMAGRATAVSILFGSSGSGVGGERREPPDCFRDLNLDQIVAAATAGREEYDLAPIFHTPLPGVEAIHFRQEIFRDFGTAAVFDCVASFSARMRVVRASLDQALKLRYELQQERWHLDAVGEYCDAVSALTHRLVAADLCSRGLAELRAYLHDYTRSAGFASLAAETEKLQADLAGIAYAVRIAGKRIEVRRYAGEADYAAEVLDTFAKFRQAAVEEPHFTFHSYPELNHIEAEILERVARLYPDIFSALAGYRERHRDFLDPAVLDFDRGAQFYLGWLEHLKPLERAGLAFCQPEVSETSKGVHGREAFDLALAKMRVSEDAPVVLNDFELRGPERIMVVSGANQGGKSTFARMVGQIHYLAGLGCPVPGREARLPRLDSVLTHFEREERVETLSGKLEESLERMRRMLERASSRSLLIMNESFESTTVSDALLLTRRVLEEVAQRDILCVCVTFLDELAALSEKTVSYVATVRPEDPARRTFKVVRKPAEGLAYAMAIAEKYGLTRERVKERIGA
ncbi:MAG: MutS-related protein [Steroidobacteraceae bacterium]